MFWPSKGYRLPLTRPGAGIRKSLKWQAVLPTSRGWPVPSILARAMHWRMAEQDRSRRLSNLFLRAHRRLPNPIYPPLAVVRPLASLRLPRKSDRDGLPRRTAETDCHTFRFGVWNVALSGNRGSQAALGRPSFYNNVCRSRLMFRFVRCQ